jgi:hypothetical protein
VASEGHLRPGEHREGTSEGTERERARGTHFLESVEGKPSQNIEQEEASKGRSLPGSRTGRNKLDHGKK